MPISTLGSQYKKPNSSSSFLILSHQFLFTLSFFFFRPTSGYIQLLWSWTHLLTKCVPLSSFSCLFWRVFFFFSPPLVASWCLSLQLILFWDWKKNVRFICLSISFLYNITLTSNYCEEGGKWNAERIQYVILHVKIG